MSEYYLRIEGVNLSNFVYDTQDLNTIRGSGLAILEAVNLLADAVIVFKDESITLKKISLGASAGLFSFTTDQNLINDKLKENEFGGNVRDYLVERNPVLQYATFVIDIIEAGNNFLTDREKLIAKNRWRQMQSPRLAIPKREENLQSGLFKRVSCEVDAVRPAKVKGSFKGGEKEISRSVDARRKYGRGEKQKFIKREIENYFDVSTINHKSARDFDDLTNGKTDRFNLNKDQGNLHHKMAVIYIDGNDFGKTQRSLEVEPLKEFDELKTMYQRKFLAELMKNIVGDSDGWQFTMVDEKGKLKTIYQLEILLWGGDEICLVVPAWKGWETLQLFYEQTRDLKFKGEDLTHSAGVVFCHHNAPVRKIKNLASELAELAKDKFRDKPAEDKFHKEKFRGENLFTYEILESFDYVGSDLDEYRRSYCPDSPVKDTLPLILNGKEMTEMTALFRKFKQQAPRRKLTEIVRRLQLPNTVEQNEILEDLRKSVVGETGQDTVNKFKGYFEGENFYWIHASRLWDYIEEKI